MKIFVTSKTLLWDETSSIWLLSGQLICLVSALIKSQIIETWWKWNAHTPNTGSRSWWCKFLEIHSAGWKLDNQGSELHHGSRQTAYCIGQTSAPLALFTSELVNRSQEGESQVGWCLASLDSVSFTRSLSIAVTSYKRRFCTLDCTMEPVGLYTEAQWFERNTNNSHRAHTGVYIYTVIKYWSKKKG